MVIFSLFSFILLVLVSLGQTNAVRGHSNSNEIPIFKGDTGLKIRSTEPPIEAKLCANATLIAPCMCRRDFPGLIIDCRYYKVNQTSIENAFREMRAANDIPEDRGIGFYEFAVIDTEMTQLDLAPFYGSQMGRLIINSNYAMTKIVTSGNPEDHGSIHTDHIQFRNLLMNREGFGDTLKYFSNEPTFFEAHGLDFSNSNNNNSSDQTEAQEEFLPGLSALSNIARLYLTNNNITGRLNSESWNFTAHSKLTYLSLGYNQINELGENIFDIGGNGTRLEIQLEYNQLNESSFHPNSGMTKPGRETQISLFYSPITTLPAPIFEPFLDAHYRNYLYFYENPFICDERLSWIKARREELEFRVSRTTCINDPGHTVFNSDLIP